MNQDDSMHGVDQDIPVHGSTTSVGSTARSARRRRAAQSEEYRAEAARLAPYEELARLVIAHRIEEDLSQAQLAARLGTSVSAISRLESGQHRPNFETLERLGRAFGKRLVIGFESQTGERELVSVGWRDRGQAGADRDVDRRAR